MARPGELIENPATGERITFRETADDTDGERLRMEYVLAPGGAPVAPHVHPEQREIIEVERGPLSARVDGEEGTVLAGQTLRIPSGVPHTIWNDGAEPVRTTVELQPALRLEEFFETLAGLARDGETDAEGRPSPLQSAVIADEFAAEIAVAGVPRWLQRPLLAVVAPVGRALGYRGSYPEYVSEPVRLEGESIE